LGLPFIFLRRCRGLFLRSGGALRGGGTGAGDDAQLFELLLVPNQRHFGDLDIQRQPGLQRLEGGVLLEGGLLGRAFGGSLWAWSAACSALAVARRGRVYSLPATTTKVTNL
jgi:hypothetical protein